MRMSDWSSDVCSSDLAKGASVDRADAADPPPGKQHRKQIAMKIATWNVNSLKVRLPHLLDWLQIANIDVLALQDIKTIDAGFTRAEREAAGYRAAIGRASCRARGCQ